jgi:hypothetical protein
VVNAGQPYTITYDEPDEVTTFCLLFQTGFVERLATAMDLSEVTVTENRGESGIPGLSLQTTLLLC